MSSSGDTVAAHPRRMGQPLSRRQSSVLENRDLCRIVCSYIPVAAMQGDDLFHGVAEDSEDDEIVEDDEEDNIDEDEGEEDDGDYVDEDEDQD